MRVISGKYKGRRIKPPKKFSSRPTTDFAKESLFNILQNQVDWEQVGVLDLFAGTGSLGLECLSRGAKYVLSVDKNPISIKHLNNLTSSFDEDWRVLRKDVFTFISSQSTQYDLIIADPPFDLKEMSQLPDLIIENDLLNEDGLFVLEHGDKISFSDHPNLVDERRYGGVHFSFFKK